MLDVVQGLLAADPSPSPGRRLLGLPAGKPTAAALARALLCELGQAEHMARAYRPDLADPDTEQHVTWVREQMRRAAGMPVGDSLLGDVDRALSREADYWAGRAAALRLELGEKFLAGGDERRAATVRDWLRNWREQGRLPRPPG